jgi:hypothetical protein
LIKPSSKIIFVHIILLISQEQSITLPGVQNSLKAIEKAKRIRNFVVENVAF